MSLLLATIDKTEFHRMFSCKTAKEIWYKLKVTFEGTSKAKITKVGIEITEFEMLKMEVRESIRDSTWKV